jgi:hypothetical protein
MQKTCFIIKTYYLQLRGSISIETTIDGQDFNRMSSIIKSAILNKEAQLQLRLKLKSNCPRRVVKDKSQTRSYYYPPLLATRVFSARHTNLRLAKSHSHLFIARVC